MNKTESNNQENRTDFFQSTLCPDLNAVYHDIKSIKDKFALQDDDLSKIKKANALSGTYDGYDYNLLEYCIYNKNLNYDSFYLIGSVKIPEVNFPEFDLIPKWSGIPSNILICLVSLPFLLLFLLVFFYMITFIAVAFIHSEEVLEETTVSNIILNLLKNLIPLGLLYIPSHFFFKSVSKIKERFFQGKYGINNAEFNSRFAFDNAKDINNIKRVFTPNVCNNIVKFKPQLSGINSKRNHLIINAEGMITSTDSCKTFIEFIVNQAKLFKKNSF